MTKPLVVVIPHQLGLAEARGRLQRGIASLKTRFGDKVAVIDERWTENRLDFAVKALGQSVVGNLEVAADAVRVEMELPWVLALVAEKAKAYLTREGTLLLGKK